MIEINTTTITITQMVIYPGTSGFSENKHGARKSCKHGFKL